MDYSEIPKKPWRPISASDQKIFLRLAKNDHDTKNKHVHQHVPPNTVLLDANGSALSLPLPNPSFAFHQFEKNIPERKSPFKSSSENTRRRLNLDLLHSNCCCGCICSSCISTARTDERYRQYYGNTNGRSSIASCDVVDITSMNLDSIDHSSVEKERITPIPANSDAKSSSDNVRETNKPRPSPLSCTCLLRQHRRHQSRRILRNLKYLYAGDNYFSSLNQFVGLGSCLSNLRELHLPGNRIRSILYHITETTSRNHDADVKLLENIDNNISEEFLCLRVLDLSHNYLFDCDDDDGRRETKASRFTTYLYRTMEELSFFNMPHLLELNLSCNIFIHQYRWGNEHNTTKTTPHHGNADTSTTSAHHYYPVLPSHHISTPSPSSFLSTHFRSLAKFHLEGNNITDADNIFSFLSQSCPSLTEVNLMRNRLTNIPKEAFEENENNDRSFFPLLETLNLGWNQFSSNKSILPLVLLGKLKRLILHGNPIVQLDNNNAKINNGSRGGGLDRVLEVAREVRSGFGNCRLTIITTDDTTTASTGNNGCKDFVSRHSSTYHRGKNYYCSTVTANIPKSEELLFVRPQTKINNRVGTDTTYDFGTSQTTTKIQNLRRIGKKSRSPLLVWEGIIERRMMVESPMCKQQQTRQHIKHDISDIKDNSTTNKIPVSARVANSKIAALKNSIKRTNREVVKDHSMRSTTSFTLKMKRTNT